jgi:hypothetical protein
MLRCILGYVCVLGFRNFIVMDGEYGDYDGGFIRELVLFFCFFIMCINTSSNIFRLICLILYLICLAYHASSLINIFIFLIVMLKLRYFSLFHELVTLPIQYLNNIIQNISISKEQSKS